MTPDRIMMALGDYRFSIDTAAYESLTRTCSWLWNAQNRLGGRPIHQYAGRGVETIDIPGMIVPQYRGGLGQIPAMEAQADRGEPLLLVDGNGKNWGDWVIVDLAETRKELLGDGTPRQIDFSLKLARYGDDTPNG